MSDVLVLHSALRESASPPAVTRLLGALPYAYRLMLERRSEPDRIASLAGVALLLEAVRRLRGEPADLRGLRVIQGGRPTLEHGPSFSIAHSATRVAVAASECFDVGLDLEDADAGGRTVRELERWTATEAVLKASGAGLRELGEVALDEDLRGARFGAERLHLRPVTVVDACVAQLASRSALSAVTVEEIDWPL